MAKARRAPFAAAERFLGLPRGAVAPAPAGFGGGGGGGGDDLPDLAEADVWYSGEQGPSPSPRPRRQPGPEAAAERRAAPRRGVRGGLSRAFGDGGRQLAASAPVEVPAWPPALPFEMEMDEDDEEEGGAGAGAGAAGWVPPHVLLARRQARASVVEGAGRTLKGRDMSRVRDAVWSRTGFDG